jgi:hypothetical protein
MNTHKVISDGLRELSFKVRDLDEDMTAGEFYLDVLLILIANMYQSSTNMAQTSRSIRKTWEVSASVFDIKPFEEVT